MSRRSFHDNALTSVFVIACCALTAAAIPMALSAQTKPNLVVEASGPYLGELRIEVSGTDLPKPLQYKIAASQESAIGGIYAPPGEMRTITIAAFDIEGHESHRGTRVANLPKGVVAPIAITLAPSNGSLPLPVVIGTYRVAITEGAPSKKNSGMTTLVGHVFDADGQPVDVPANAVHWSYLDARSGRPTILDKRHPLNGVHARMRWPNNRPPIEDHPPFKWPERQPMLCFIVQYSQFCVALAQAALAGHIAAGSAHTCAINDSNVLKCWGFNFAGQVGDGSIVDRKSPVAVTGVAAGAAKRLAAGGYRSCLLGATANLKCWGENDPSQDPLGVAGAANALTPADVLTLTAGVGSAAVSFNHACAVTTTGGAKCWGGNTLGQIGDATAVMRPAPVDVSGLMSGVVAVATGFGHSCAIVAAGKVKCWGNNGSGQVGDGTTTPRFSPVDVKGLTGPATAIALGEEHSCAIVAGSVQCWGAYGLPGASSTAVTVCCGGSVVNAISGGGTHTLALLASGDVQCWGYEGSGQCGDGHIFTTGQFNPSSSSPVIVLLGGPAAAIAAGGSHSCVMMQTGDVKCFGDNGHGQLGNSTPGVSALPVIVTGF